VEIMPEFKEKFVKLYQDIKGLVNA